MKKNVIREHGSNSLFSPEEWIEAIPEASALIDESGLIMLANSALVKLLGDTNGKRLTEGDLELDTSLYELLNNPDMKCIARSNGGEYTVKVRPVGRDSHLYLLTLSTCEANGNTELKLKKAIDIRTRLLKVVEDKYRKIYEESPVGIVQVDPNYEWISANPTFTALVGGEEPMAERTLDLMVHRDDRSEFRQVFTKWLEGGTADYRCRMIGARGRVMHAAIKPQLIDIEGRVSGLQLIVMDVTEATEALLNAESELENINDSLENIMRYMNDALVVLGPDGRISRVNDKTCELVGRSSEELIDKPIGILFAGPDEEITEYMQKFASIIKKSPGREIDSVWRDARGVILPIGLTATVMRGRDGKLSGVLAVARDLREDRNKLKLEETNVKLEKALAELKILDEAKDDLMSMVGHELRTPLTSLRGFAELMTMDKIGEERRIEFARKLVDEVDRMNRMVSDILDIAKMNAGKLSFEFQPASISNVVRNCVERVKAIADKKELKITESFEACPNIVMDADRMKQVVDNLLSNAVKFSNTGGLIEVRITDHVHFIKVAVQDHGVGIPDDARNAVFGKFEQTPDGRRTRVGTGLGMPISKSIIENAHRGVLWFESEGEGKGATFLFTIPKNLKPTVYR